MILFLGTENWGNGEGMGGREVYQGRDIVFDFFLARVEDHGGVTGGGRGGATGRGGGSCPSRVNIRTIIFSQGNFGAVHIVPAEFRA